MKHSRMENSRHSARIFGPYLEKQRNLLYFPPFYGKIYTVYGYPISLIRKGSIKMSHKLILHNFGPIKDCTIELNEFNVITGPQSQGKSTIAKAVYFFRSVKQIAVDIMRSGGPEKFRYINPLELDANNSTWSTTLKNKMRYSFTNISEGKYLLLQDTTLRYEYGSGTKYIEISDDTENLLIDFHFSPDVEAFFKELDNHSFAGMEPAQLKKEEEALFTFFDDPYEVFYIPAGRSVMAVLSDQLPFLFNSLDFLGSQKIDQLFRNYATQIFKLKPLLLQGLEGFLSICQKNGEYTDAYASAKDAILLIQCH